MTGLFARWQSLYAEQGIPTFPVRDKQPAVRGCQTFSSRNGPPEIATAAPTAIGSCGKANQSNNTNQNCEPPLASNLKPIGDVVAMLIGRLECRRGEPGFRP
jgi:hypothetical protein